MITATFNGIELTEYFKILDIDRDLLPARQNYSVDSEFRHGTDFDGYKYNNRVIKVKAVLLTDDTEKLQVVKRELAGALDVEEPAQLIFSDEPDKYYLAVLDGSTAIDQFLGNGTVELDFICHDPFAYAVEETVVQNISESTEIEVVNDGTHVSYPILEAEMTSQNSLVAFINERGKILQFGDPDLTDQIAVKRPEVLINNRNMGDRAAVEATGWKVNADSFPGKFLGQHSLVCNGTIKYHKEVAMGKTVDLLGVGNYGTGSQYHGISLTQELPADSSGHVGANSFELKVGLFFVTSSISQTGLSLIELRDKQDNQVCSLAYYKNITTNNTATIRINVMDKYAANVKTFETNHWNPYTSVDTELGIYKYGQKIEFHTGGIQNGGVAMGLDFDFLKDVEVTKVIWYAGVYGNNSPLINSIRSCSFVKKDVDAVEAVPTLFNEGDVLTADTATGLVRINDMDVMNLDTLGNQWEEFYLEKGSNKITTVHSDFSDVPKTRIRYRKRWL